MSRLLPAEYQEFLHGPLRRYFLATLFGSLGTGLILSLALIYVHDVRHLSVSFAANLFSMNAILGLAFSPLMGSVTDHFGPTKSMVPGMVVQAIGMYLFAYATTPWGFVVASIVMVTGGSGTWSASSTLLTRLITPEQRQRAYGLNFMLLNLGIGFGALISTQVVNRSVPSSFTHLYLATAALSLCAAITMVTLHPFGRPVPRPEDLSHGVRGGWLEVIKDRRLVHYVVASLILMICGYGSIETGFSLFITHSAGHLSQSFSHTVKGVTTYFLGGGLSIKTVGLIFAFNTATIVFAQVYAIRFIQGRRRTRILGLVGLLWGISWLVVALTSQLPKWWALGLLCVASCIFALGETFWMPTGQSLVNDMAPEHLRGRYNSASGLMWGLSAAIAPQITGLFFAAHLGELWPLFIAAMVFLGGMFATTLRRSISDEMDGVGLAKQVATP